MTRDTEFRSVEVGRHRVTVIRDVTFACPVDLLLAGDQRARWEPLVRLDDRRRVALPVNCLLIESDGRTILVDGGDGLRSERPRDENGRLLDHLAALGVDRDRVDTVFLTHAHSDHVAGLATPGRDGLEPTFPSAEHLVAAAEAERMADPARRAPRAPGLVAYDEAAREAYEVLDRAGVLRSFTPGQAIAPGITPLAAPGHAAGHCALLIEDEEACFLFLADVLHFDFEFDDPGLHGDFDSDVGQVVADKERMIDLALARDAIVAGSHLPDLTLRLSADLGGRVIGFPRCP